MLAVGSLQFRSALLLLNMQTNAPDKFIKKDSALGLPCTPCVHASPPRQTHSSVGTRLSTWKAAFRFLDNFLFFPLQRMLSTALWYRYLGIGNCVKHPQGIILSTYSALYFTDEEIKT